MCYNEVYVKHKLQKIAERNLYVQYKFSENRGVFLVNVQKYDRA